MVLAAVLHGKKDLRIEPVEAQPLAADEVRVTVAYGGICGSDMHYYHRGAVGDFALRQPMVLGHEISGVVVEVGTDVKGVVAGEKAALNPSRACRVCEQCVRGRSNLCENMRFLGSAARFPHIQGGFAQELILRADQVIPVPAQTDLLKLSCAEPVSVALHAVRRAGDVLGKRVLVTGCGPIGLLTVRAAVLAGALEVVATDIEDAPLSVASQSMGARQTVNVAANPGGLSRFQSGGRGYFDVALEASGSIAALQSMFPVIKRGGRIIQLGMLPSTGSPLPVNVLQSREIELTGSFRAHDEFATAVDMIVNDTIDVSPITSGTYPLKQADAAFERAGDRSRVVKLHLAITSP